MGNISNLRQNKKIDPSGIDMAFEIANIILGGLTIYVQYKVACKKRANKENEKKNKKEERKKSNEENNINLSFISAEKQVLSLNYEITELVKIFVNAEKYENISNRKPTFMDTMLEFDKDDFKTYLDVKSKINSIRDSFYEILMHLYKSSPELINNVPDENSIELIKQFDKFIMRYGSLTFAQVIDELRTLSHNLYCAFKNHNYTLQNIQ